MLPWRHERRQPKLTRVLLVPRRVLPSGKLREKSLELSGTNFRFRNTVWTDFLTRGMTRKARCGCRSSRVSSAYAVEQYQTPTIWNALPKGTPWDIYYHDIWNEGQCYTEYTFPWCKDAHTGV